MPYRRSDLVVPSTPNSALESPDEVVHNGCVHKCGKEEVEPQWAHGLPKKGMVLGKIHRKSL